MSEVFCYTGQNLVSFMFTKFFSQPLLCVAICLFIIAATYTMTSWYDIVGRVTAILAEWHKMILGQSMPQSLRSTAVCATVVPPIESVKPVGVRKSGGQVSFKCFALLFVLAHLLTIVFVPQRFFVTSFFSIFFVAFSNTLNVFFLPLILVVLNSIVVVLVVLPMSISPFLLMRIVISFRFGAIARLAKFIQAAFLFAEIFDGSRKILTAARALAQIFWPLLQPPGIPVTLGRTVSDSSFVAAGKFFSTVGASTLKRHSTLTYASSQVDRSQGSVSAAFSPRQARLQPVIIPYLGQQVAV